MIRRVLTPLVLVLATSAGAQQSQRNYESMGTIAVKIDGTAHELFIPYMVDEGDGHAELVGPVASMQSPLIGACNCTDGDLDAPSVNLSVIKPGPSAIGSNFNLNTTTGTTYIAGDDMGIGSFEVSDVQLSDGHATLAFEATAVAVEREGFDYLPVYGVEPAVISGNRRRRTSAIGMRLTAQDETNGQQGHR